MIQFIKSLFNSTPPRPQHMSGEMKDFLSKTVAFYQALNAEDKIKFEQRCLSFLQVAEIVGHQVNVTEADKFLVACGSVILAWGFEHWEYVHVDTVYLVPGSFNEDSEFGKKDSRIVGLVGNQHLKGKMILSQPALHHGFSNDKDKQNVAIHEFAHLIDMADGDCDGLPREIVESAFCLPWLEMVRKGISDINQNKSNIRDYGATNQSEFFAVLSEYFFEQPKMLKRKHPSLYKSLEKFYRQNLADLKQIARTRKKAPCPCGSGKRYKRCCFIKES